MRLLSTANHVVCFTCGDNGVDDLVVVRNSILVDGAVKSSTWRREEIVVR